MASLVPWGRLHHADDALVDLMEQVKDAGALAASQIHPCALAFIPSGRPRMGEYIGRWAVGYCRW